MKQRIISKQLDELSRKGRGRLSFWLDNFRVKNPPLLDDRGFAYPKTLALLTIGQMIEFLVDHKVDWYQDGFFNSGTKDMAEHLCDSLWIAVKKILEEK